MLDRFGTKRYNKVTHIYCYSNNMSDFGSLGIYFEQKIKVFRVLQYTAIVHTRSS